MYKMRDNVYNYLYYGKKFSCFVAGGSECAGGIW